MELDNDKVYYLYFRENAEMPPSPGNEDDSRKVRKYC
jgi:hypothetical protein